jgi:hypothetical protein
MTRKSIRGGMGLGDALYVQSVARHLVKKGISLRVHTAWPDVFRSLYPDAKVAPFCRTGIDILAHYPSRKKISGTTQFEDCCISAGIREPVELRLDWEPTNLSLIYSLQTYGKPIVFVQLPRAPMGRTDGFGKELLPDCRSIQHAIDAIRDRALIVQIGSGKPLHRFSGIDVDLADQTSITDLLDIATVASAFIGYVSFIVPLAESLDKPALLVWSRRGLVFPAPVYVREITPKKILHKPSSRFVMDDAPIEQIQEAANALF